MSEVILEANVVPARFDAADVLHGAATALTKRLERDGVRVVVLDCVANEVRSVLARRLASLRRALDLFGCRPCSRLRERKGQDQSGSFAARPRDRKLPAAWRTVSGRVSATTKGAVSGFLPGEVSKRSVRRSVR